MQAVVLAADNPGRLYLQYHSLLTRASIRILVYPSVLLRHLIDMLLSYMSGQLIDHLASNHDQVVRIILVRNGKSDIWILLHVAMFNSADRCVYEYELPVSVNPGGSHLRGPVRVHSRQIYEILTLQHLSSTLRQTCQVYNHSTLSSSLGFLSISLNRFRANFDSMLPRRC